MIRGIGTDVVSIPRIEQALGRFGDRFVRRILTEAERARFERLGERVRASHLAKRFAAKEAFSKAIGLGLRGPMTLLSLQVLNDARGKPVAHARKELEPYLRERRLVAHVSLSDEVDSAVAFVVIEVAPQAPPQQP